MLHALLLLQFCKTSRAQYFQVAFKIQLVKGSSLKEVALKAAIHLKATWLILDRSGKNKTNNLNSLDVLLYLKGYKWNGM